MTDHPGNEHPGDPRDVQDSHHDAAGDMGVSSEREGPTGHGRVGTDGVRDVSPPDPDEPDADVPPEQRPGAVETNPEGLPPKAGYSSRDPRSDD